MTIYYTIIWHYGLDVWAEDGISKMHMEDKWGYLYGYGHKGKNMKYSYKYK